MAKDAPYIRSIATSWREGTDALLGFSLSAPPRKTLKNEDANRYYQEASQGQKNVIRALWNSGIAAWIYAL